MDWTPTNITAVATALATLIAALSSKQIVEAYIRISDHFRAGRERQMELESIENELEGKGHKFIIRRQDKQISDMHKQIDELYTERNQCREEYAVLENKHETLSRRVTYLEEQRKKKGYDSTETEKAEEEK